MKAFLEFQFPDNARLLPLDEAKHVAQVLRFLSTIRIKQLSWRERRPYLLVDALSFTPSDGDVGTLCASGYLRGGPLSANDLVYIPDFGDFRLSKVGIVVFTIQRLSFLPPPLPSSRLKDHWSQPPFPIERTHPIGGKEWTPIKWSREKSAPCLCPTKSRFGMHCLIA